MKKKNPPAQLVQGLESGLDCLLHLVSASKPLGCRELARMTGLEPTRVNRLLGTLAYIGMAAQTPDKKYIPGPGINIIAALSMRSSPLLKIALPAVKELSQRLNQGISLGVLWGRRVCYLYHGMDESFAAITERHLFPAEDSSIGLSLLAFQSNSEIAELFPDNDEILSQVENVRKNGYAVGKQNSISVCIGGELQLGGLAVNTLEPKINSLKKVLKELNLCADKITNEWQLNIRNKLK